MISISVDDRKNEWKNALRVEKMPWKQLVMKGEALTYARELFGYDQRVPLTLFVSSEGKIVKSFVGYGKKSTGQFEGLIRKHAAARKRQGTL
jgi:hypothetical protein